MRKLTVLLLLLAAGAASAQQQTQSDPAKPALTATVIKIVGERAALDVGAQHGVKAGAVFRLYSPVRIVRIPLTGAVTYQEEEPVGMLVVGETEGAQCWGDAEVFAEGAVLKAGMAAVFAGHKERVTGEGTEITLEAESGRVVPGQWLRLKVNGAPTGSTCHWKAAKGWLSAQTSIDPGVFWAAPDEPGAGEVSVRVVSPGGSTSEATVRIEVTSASPVLPEKYVQHTLSGRLLASGEEPRVSDVAADAGSLYFLDARMGGLYRHRGVMGVSECVGSRRGRKMRGPFAVAVKNGKAYVLDDDYYRIKQYNVATGKQDRLLGKAAPARDVVDLAVGDAGILYVLDRSSCKIHIINTSTGLYQLSFGRKGKQKGWFQDPIAIGLDADGNIYILDAAKKVVEVYSAVMANLATLKLNMQPANRPLDLAVSRAGSFYVLEGPKTAIAKYSLNGRLVTRSKGEVFPGLPQGAFRIATDDAAAVYVVQGNRAGIHHYTAAGEYMGLAGMSSPRPAFGIAVAPNGSYALHYAEKPFIECYDAAGWLSSSWGESFRQPVLFSVPGRICYRPDGAMIYVMGPGNMKSFRTLKRMFHVLGFSSKGKFLGYFGGQGQAYGRFLGQQDLAADRTGAVWALDDIAFRVSAFGDDPNQPLVRNLVRGKSEKHEIAAPALLAVDPDGAAFYIYDQRIDAVKRFGRDGAVVAVMDGRKLSPRIAEAVRIVNVYKGVVALLDQARNTVFMLDFTGSAPSLLRTAEFKDVDGRIRDIGIDGAGRVLGVSDKSTVYVLSRY